MSKLRNALCAGVALGLFVPTQAAARRIVIDQGEFLPSGSLGTGCVIGGAACSATILPFSFDFGTGSTNQAFIYDRGIISFGDGNPERRRSKWSFHELRRAGDRAACMFPAQAGTPGPYQVGTATIAAGDFVETLPNFGNDLFLINFLDPTTIDQNNNLSALISVIFDFSPDGAPASSSSTA